MCVYECCYKCERAITMRVWSVTLSAKARTCAKQTLTAFQNFIKTLYVAARNQLSQALALSPADRQRYQPHEIL